MSSNLKSTTNRVNNNKFNGKNYKSLDQINLIRKKNKIANNSNNNNFGFISMESNNNLASSYFKELYLKIFSNGLFMKSNFNFNDTKEKISQW